MTMLLTLSAVFASTELSAAGRGMVAEQLMSYMFRNSINKVCLQIEIDADGKLSVFESSGNKQTDRVALQTVDRGGELAFSQKRAVDVSEGRKRLPLSVDISAQLKNGKVHCVTK